MPFGNGAIYSRFRGIPEMGYNRKIKFTHSKDLVDLLVGFVVLNPYLVVYLQ